MKPITASLSFVLVFAMSAVADDIHLKDGTVISGQVSEEKNRLFVVDRGKKHSIRKADVVKVVKGESFMDVYAKRLAKLPSDDAEAIYEFGQWLVENDWAARAQRVFEAVLDIDADHRGARRALGYKLYEGEWVSPEDLNRRKGLVEFESRWYTKHDLSELKKEIEGNEKLRQAYAQRRKVNDKINKLSRGFASFDRKKRLKAYHRLVTYAEQLNSPELRQFADDTAAYYDYLTKALCRQMMARTEINAVLTKLKKPIDTFETSLGAAIAIFSAQNPVRIQLPEIAVAQVQTTVDIPAGCHG